MGTAIMGTPTEAAREHLREHYEDVLRGYGLLFEKRSARPPAQWPAWIEYRMTGGVAYYYNERKTQVLPLEFPKALEASTEKIKSHLGPENWATWEGLVRDTNSHLEAVTQEWARILDEFGKVVHDIGLVQHESLYARPLDVYWPSKFLQAIWDDVGYYDRYKTHQWESVKIIQLMTVVPMRHSEDAVMCFEFKDLPWILTQSQQAAEEMKRAWENEAIAVEPRVWDLLQERSRIEARTAEFISTLRRVEMEYTGYRKNLPFSCETCRPWLDELQAPPT